METNQLNAHSISGQPPRLSVIGIIFLLMGVPNVYAFFQRRADNVAYNGGGVPRYAFVVLVAMAIAGIVELTAIGAA